MTLTFKSPGHLLRAWGQNFIGHFFQYYRRQIMVLALVVLLACGFIHRGRAEDTFTYRYEKYQEGNGRIGVETHSGNFDVTLQSWLSFKGEVVNDAVSGATPTGRPAAGATPAGSYGNTYYGSSFDTAYMKDNRMGGFGEPTFTFGANRISTQFSYSGESDYISRGVALNYSRDFNQKNTTLNLGWSHDFDTIEKGNSPYSILFENGNLKKDSDEFIIGVNQLLGPKTILTANFEVGYANGYLGDPYKGFWFYDGSGNPESRPGQRTKEIVYAGLTQFITPLDASVEGSYRFYTDSFGVTAHTVSLAWYQKLGRQVVVAPSFRYYYQTAADFYHVTLPGYFNAYAPDTFQPGDSLPDGNTQPALPKYYSADYRLSELQSMTIGVSVNWKVADHFYIDAAYERYIMQGLDGVTDSGVYPNANVFTLGARVTF